jgi:hypothetical protein
MTGFTGSTVREERSEGMMTSVPGRKQGERASTYDGGVDSLGVEDQGNDETVETKNLSELVKARKRAGKFSKSSSYFNAPGEARTVEGTHNEDQDHTDEQPRLLGSSSDTGVTDDTDGEPGGETGETDGETGSELDEAVEEGHWRDDWRRYNGDLVRRKRIGARVEGRTG